MARNARPHYVTETCTNENTASSVTISNTNKRKPQLELIALSVMRTLSSQMLAESATTVGYALRKQRHGHAKVVDKSQCNRKMTDVNSVLL